MPHGRTKFCGYCDSWVFPWHYDITMGACKNCVALVNRADQITLDTAKHDTEPIKKAPDKATESQNL